MSLNETDEEIIELFKSSDQNAFRGLVEKYTPNIYNFTARLVGKNNADDMVQEVFIKTWKNLKHFDPKKASFKTWIFTIAKNTTTDFLRKKKSLSFSDLENYDSDSELSFVESIPDEELLPPETLQKLNDKELLNKTLNNLKVNYKEVLTLHYQEEMTFDEIGKILHKPLNTVKSEHRRAIIELRKIIDK
jgi:RNA polymerase sigma-70 factor (ECF subfamily)